MASMKKSWLIGDDPLDGLPLDRVISLPAMPNEKTPSIYALAHVGLFPNRCEAGTNMVMTEFMACARPVIASDWHGHRDVLCAESYKLSTGDLDAAGWFNPPVSDIIAHLEHAYAHREELAERGAAHRRNIERFTWDACARQILAHL